MKRIIFLNRYFYPDHSATSQILSDLAFHLAGRGHDVQVITSQQRYDDPDARLPKMAAINGVRIHRLPTTRFGRAALLGRGFDYLSFYAAVGRCIGDQANRGDILVAKTDPPLLCLPAMRAAKRHSLHLVNWLQDLYPEVAMELDVPFLRGPIGRALSRWRDRSLQAAKANVTVGARMANKVSSRGVAPQRVHVIPNWCDDEKIHPIPSADNPLRHEWGLEDKFVIGYSGNLGRGHEFDTVIAAAERLRDHPRIIFLCIGGGHKFDEFARHVGARQLDRLFRFISYRDRAELKYSLTAPDIHWLSLKPELEGLIVPSKFYGIAAAGRPVIAITAKNGEIAELIRQYDCGCVIEPGDGGALADILTRLSADAAGVAAMGARARTMLDGHFTRAQALQKWCDLLEQIE